MRVCGTESIHDKYDKKYFEDKSLAIVYVVTGSGGTRVVYKDYEILDNKIKINYEKKNSGGISTDDMHGFYVVVEVPKNKIARHTGTYQYETKNEILKTVPVIELFDR
jgi:hypothetical protein